MDNRVKELRNKKGITQVKLSLEVGCSQNTISKIESGICDPKASVMIALAKYFGVSLDYLMGLSNHKWVAEQEFLLTKAVGEHAELIMLFDGLNKEHQETIMLLLRHLDEIQKRDRET